MMKLSISKLKSNVFTITTRPMGLFNWGQGKREKCEKKKQQPDPTLTCFLEKASSLPDGGDSGRVNPDCCAPKVLIIGAGMAGLSAACLLHCRGIKDIYVLEATNRPGGRIFSCWLGDATIEMGPTAIEGATLANPVYNLANIAGLITPGTRRSLSKKAVFLTRDGRMLSDYQLEELIFRHIINKAKGLCKTETPQLKTNLLQFMSLRIQQELLQFPEVMRYDSERIMFGLANSLKSQFGADLSDISASHLSSMKVMPGPTAFLDSGFSSILTPLLLKIPDDRLLFNKRVNCISLTKEPKLGDRVQVKTCDGSIYKADYVIVTLPIGVLKGQADTIFGEDICSDKLDAINKIGVGVVNRIYLEYSAPWWAAGGGNIKLAWSGEELSHRHDWTKGIGEISEAPNSRQVIFFTIGGEEALLLEKSSETEIAIEFTKFLRKFTGDGTISYPSNILMSRWCNNPTYMGSTVYMSVDTRVGHFKTMGNYGTPCSKDGKPPAILFAGDGTIPDYFGTVLGARKSGIREANRIIEQSLRECEKDLEEECEEQKRKEEASCSC